MIYSVDTVTGFFQLENDTTVIDLIREDLTAIEILFEELYTEYISGTITITKNGNSIDVINTDADITINIDKSEYKILLEYIKKLKMNTAQSSDIYEEEYTYTLK